MNHRLAALVCAAVLAPLAAAHADETEVVTLGAQGHAPVFDPTLGALQSLTVAIDITEPGFTVDVDNTSTRPQTVDALLSFTGTFVMTPLGGHPMVTSLSDGADLGEQIAPVGVSQLVFPDTPFEITESLGAAAFIDVPGYTPYDFQVKINPAPIRVISEVSTEILGPTSISPNGVSTTWTFDYVPEPASWALMFAGFGLAGAALRRRRADLATA